jgi:hypothetical protein
MKGRLFSSKLIILTIILFICLFLFSSPSLALIPGDFGSTGGGLPDGAVDFEDLMIFAMAYGSTPADANWNALCNIYPDDKIDFEDLMIFAMHYGERERVNWTVMVYLDGDNTLDYYAWDDLSEMESIGSSNEINIITQVDLYNSCSGTYRYFVTGTEQGSTYPLYSNDIVQTLPEQNMADPAVLNNFINWGINNYPADHYILILWNHGGGWREESDAIKGIIFDDTNNDFLTMAELVQGLDNTEEPLDVIGFDACLMQMAEIYYEFGTSITTTSLPLYGIGSEESEWGDGWPYDLILADLISNPSMTESTLCETIVSDYVSYCGSVGTLSALYFSPELTQSTEVFNVFNSFTNALMSSTYQDEINLARSSAQSYSSSDYKDFYDFAEIIKNNVPDCQSEAQVVMDLIDTVVISEAHTGFSVDNSHGLSIYLPDSSGDYDNDYDTLQFAIDTQWDEFLKSGEEVVTGVQVAPETRQISTSLVPEGLSSLEKEGNFLTDYQIANVNEGLKGETEYRIRILWDAYYNVDGYRVYRKVDNGEYTMIYELQNPPVGDFGYGFYDSDISEGNTYSCYVTAYGADWETNPSEIASIEITAYTFLPACSLIDPTDNSIITDTNPVFTWNPVGLGASDLPYGNYYSGSTFLRIYDENTSDLIWNFRIDDMTTSTATYNQDGMADPLVFGNTYRWYICTNGYNNNGYYESSSFSETWEFNYGNVVSQVDAYAIIYQSTSMEMFQAKMDKLVEEELIPDSLFLNELPPTTKGVTEHVINVDWHSYPDATGYKVFRSVNGGLYSLVFQGEPTTGYDWYGFYDYDVSEGNSYTYYATAYGSGWETDPSPTVTIDTWLPPCSLISPADESIITNPTPTFIWNPVGALSFPYGSIYSGRSNLDIYDQTASDWVWYPYFDDITTSSATYNQDGQATPLAAGNGYEWDIYSFGYNENGKLIAYSWSEFWEFVYSGGANAGVIEVEAEAETYVSESMMIQYLTEIQTNWLGEGYFFNETEPAKEEINHDIWINWKGFCEASGYGFKIYRSINGGSFEIILSGEAPIGYSWYGFVDNSAGPGNTYTYYVTAYGPDWESDPSQTMTIDTWLPPCSLVSPADGSLISNPNPTFVWNPVITDFPYGSLVTGRTCMLVYDDTTSDFTWIVCTGDPNVSTATYNQDGDALPLINGHDYLWHCWNSGYDENGYRIAVSESIDWHFDYTGP